MWNAILPSKTFEEWAGKEPHAGGNTECIDMQTPETIIIE